MSADDIALPPTAPIPHDVAAAWRLYLLSPKTWTTEKWQAAADKGFALKREKPLLNTARINAEWQVTDLGLDVYMEGA
jgi:hypothetical protein